MSLHVTAIMLGVRDLERAKRFYRDGLGCVVAQDHPGFVSLQLGADGPSLALYPWDAAAGDAGVGAEGSGFRGSSLHCIVDSRAEVDQLLEQASGAGGRLVRPAEAAQWGGYLGYFSDLDGHLWKAATSS